MDSCRHPYLLAVLHVFGHLITGPVRDVEVKGREFPAKLRQRPDVLRLGCDLGRPEPVEPWRSAVRGFVSGNTFCSDEYDLKKEDS